LLRAAAGGVLLWGGLGVRPVLAVAEGEPRSAAYQVLAVQAGIAILAVLIQAVRYEKHRLSFFPPIFFLAGLSVGMCGYKTAAFAFVFIWAVNPALKNARAFLTFYALSLYVFGALFRGFGSIPVALLALMSFLPVLLSLLTNRPLLAFTRRSGRSL
jgi:hypothetical protein